MLTLSWEDITRLHAHPLATIGNHTHSHPIFNNLSLDEVRTDILKAQNLFLSHGIAPKHFAYPFGTRVEVDSTYFKIPQSLGFISATTTRTGTIYQAHKHHLSALPRFMLSESFTLNTLHSIRKTRVVID